MKHTKQQILKIFILLVLTAAFAMFGTTVFAADGPDMNETGSISITFIDSTTNDPVPGGTVTLYHIAELSYSDMEYSYVYTEAFADCTLSLDDLEANSLASSLSAYATTNIISGDLATADANGVCTFDELPLGLYLAVQSQAASGYYAVQPFLITVPMTDEDGYVYDVDATPKMQGVTQIPESSTPESSTPESSSTPSTDDSSSRNPNAGVGGVEDENLPQTGQLNWPIPVLAGAGVLLFFLGWALTFSRKKKNV